jgi:hypothetical protein
VWKGTKVSTFFYFFRIFIGNKHLKLFMENYH